MHKSQYVPWVMVENDVVMHNIFGLAESDTRDGDKALGAAADEIVVRLHELQKLQLLSYQFYHAARSLFLSTLERRAELSILSLFASRHQTGASASQERALLPRSGAPLTGRSRAPVILDAQRHYMTMMGTVLPLHFRRLDVWRRVSLARTEALRRAGRSALPRWASLLRSYAHFSPGLSRDVSSISGL
jgi:hypothetical protein